MSETLNPEENNANGAEDEINDPHMKDVDMGGAHIFVTDDADAAPPAQADMHQEPEHPEDVPKEGMHIPHPPPDELFDCTIIGGGPTGLYAAFYAGMREMSVKIVDSLGELGGQVSALYPEKYIYDVAGFPKVLGKELVAACVEQGLQFGPMICLGEKVEHLEKQDDGTFVLVTDKHRHRTKTIIIAAGVGAFAPRKLPNAAELQIDALEGRNVYYFVKSLEEFRDKNLLIVGGGDSAMDWALNLEPIAGNITLIHRRDKWRAHEDTVRKVLNSSVDVKVFHEVRSVQQGNGGIESVTIYHNKTKEEVVLDVDTMILSLGFIANIGPIREWGLEIVDGGVAVNQRMETSIPGIYAAGDVARFPGKLNLIATGFGEAGTAANFAKSFIDPASKAFPGHSSEK